jgi:phosphoglycerate dehydrogenase-like enzyme
MRRAVAAEHAMALMLAMTRKAAPGAARDNSGRRHAWTRHDCRSVTARRRSSAARRFLIVRLGWHRDAVGSSQLVQGVRLMRVNGLSKRVILRPAAMRGRLGVTPTAELKALLSRRPIFVALTCPLNIADTEKVIDAERFFHG